MIQWHIETRKIKSLKPHQKNPRKLSKHDAEHLKVSLEKFGLIDKPIITKAGVIIGGHQRVELLKKMGRKEIDCWVCDEEMGDKDIDELNIKLNRATGKWDWDILANDWEDQELLEWGFEITELVRKDPPEEKGDPKKKPLKKCPECGHEF